MANAHNSCVRWGARDRLTPGPGQHVLALTRDTVPPKWRPAVPEGRLLEVSLASPHTGRHAHTNSHMHWPELCPQVIKLLLHGHSVCFPLPLWTAEEACGPKEKQNKNCMFEKRKSQLPVEWRLHLVLIYIIIKTMIVGWRGPRVGSQHPHSHL